MKRCSCCGESKPLATFAKDKRRPDGRGSYCKACENTRNRERAAQYSANYTPASTDGERTCSTCGESKPLTEYGRRRDSPIGLRSACNKCKRVADAAAMRRWRERNPELTLELARAYREQNRTKERERFRRYDETHREKRRLAIAKSRAENPEHHRQLQHRWREANLDKARAHCRHYFHQRRANTAPDPDLDIYADYLRAQPCAYCGTTKAGFIDHVKPISRGGLHARDNIVAACPRCNTSKSNRLLSEWSGPPVGGWT